MVQRKLVLSDLSIGYEGLFDAADLLKMVDEWFEKNGYHKNDIRHTERIKEKGKTIDLEIMPFKKISDYVQYDINVHTVVNNMTETKIKKDGQDIKINKGNIHITINAFLVTDVGEQMESKAMFFFFRALFDKFIHKTYTDRYEKEMLDDVQNLHSELKAYLNLSRYVNPA